MPQADLRELASYLVQCSRASLGSFYLTRLDRASQLERDVRDTLREWALTMGAVELADLLRQHGEEIIATSARALPAPSRSLPERQSWPFTASNWFPIQDAFDRTNPRAFLDASETLVCWAIFRSANAEGWATLSLEAIGDRARVSAIRAKHIVRALKRRRVLEGDNKPGLKSRYRIRPIDEWREPSHEVRKPQPATRAELRMQVGGPRPTLWTPKGRVELRGTPSLRLHHGDGSLAAKIEIEPGPVMIKVPVSSSMEVTGVASDPGADETRVVDNPGPTACNTRVADNPGTVESPVTPGSPATRVKPPEPMPTRVASDPGPLPAAPKSTNGHASWHTLKIPVAGKGVLTVSKPPSRRLFASVREESWALALPPEKLLAFVRDQKGYEAAFEAAAPQLAPKRAQLVLKRGPSGTWDKAKRELQASVNPHSFSTWFANTREEGIAADGALVVRVPGNPFRKQLSENFRQAIRQAIGAATGKTPMHDVNFVLEGEYEIVLPATAGR